MLTFRLGKSSVRDLWIKLIHSECSYKHMVEEIDAPYAQASACLFMHLMLELLLKLVPTLQGNYFKRTCRITELLKDADGVLSYSSELLMIAPIITSWSTAARYDADFEYNEATLKTAEINYYKLKEQLIAKFPILLEEEVK